MRDDTHQAPRQSLKDEEEAQCDQNDAWRRTIRFFWPERQVFEDPAEDVAAGLLEDEIEGDAVGPEDTEGVPSALAGVLATNLATGGPGKV